MLRRFSMYGGLLALGLLAACGGRLKALDAALADASVDVSVHAPRSDSGTDSPVLALDSGADVHAHVPDSGADARARPVDSSTDSEIRTVTEAGPDAATDGATDAHVEACVPETCEQLGFNCGTASDGCGGELQCGVCVAPASCGGWGLVNMCGDPCSGVRTTCAQLGISCGFAGDGCGGTLDCGSCPTGQGCGTGGIPGQCS
jgi:hypothetical protein